MSEFGDMLREAFIGDEPYIANKGREELERSVKKFEARMRVVRWLTGVMLTFSTLAFIAGITLLVRTDDQTTTRELGVYTFLFAFGLVTIGFGKMWFSQMQNHIALMKEIKVTQIRIEELASHGAN